MALTDEQRAMLQLLLEGGQSYDDIGSLLGIAPDEVRSRARDALREMGGADPDAEVGLSDYLLGQADPIGRADAVRHLQNDPEANALAERLLTQLRLLAPKAELPEIPAAKGGRRAAAPPPPPPAAAPADASAPAPPAAPKGPGLASRASGFLSGLGGGKRRTQLIVAGVAAIALVAVVVVVASGSEGEKAAEDCPTVDPEQAQQAGLPVIPLQAAEDPPEGECSPSGQLTLVATKKQLGLQINAVSLPPTGEDETYIVWLYQTDQQSLPVAAQASQDGNLTGAVPVSQELGGLIASGAFASVRVSLASQSDAQTLVQAQGQGKQQSPVAAFVGTTVLEGPLPQPEQGAAPGQAPQGQAPQGQGQGAQGGGAATP